MNLLIDYTHVHIYFYSLSLSPLLFVLELLVSVVQALLSPRGNLFILAPQYPLRRSATITIMTLVLWNA